MEFNDVTLLLVKSEKEEVIAANVGMQSNNSQRECNTVSSLVPVSIDSSSKAQVSEQEDQPLLYTVYEKDKPSDNNLYHLDAEQGYSEYPTCKDVTDTRSLQSCKINCLNYTACDVSLLYSVSYTKIHHNTNTTLARK